MLVHGRECKNQHDFMQAILLASNGADAETLLPQGSRSKIADVVFRDEETWIWEIKSIEVDRPSTNSIQEKLGERMGTDQERYSGPVVFGLGRVPLRALPESTAKSFLRLLGQTVLHAVQAANKQIKATRSILNIPEAKGCLCLITPPHELDYEVIGWLVADAIREDRNSAVQSVLIAQTPVLAPFGQFTDGGSSLVPLSRDGVALPQALLQRIAERWAEAHGQELVIGLPPRGWHGIRNR